jgi:ectoine hydroxylase-related dioxygenase (phytanoyl-CoA dioxygenase family)
MAAFVAHGFLRFDEIVPRELCDAALAELTAGFEPTPYRAARDSPEAAWPGQPLATLWRDSPAIGPVLQLPRVAGIVQSLLGPGALYDHHYAHVIPPRQRWSQPWHADAIIDPRRHAFDIQLFFFFHDTPREAGGTMILPGSHFRRVNESDIARTQNFRGQVPTVCPAGTLLVCHHGLWHCGQPNHTDQPRTMLKLRLGPAVHQSRHFDLRDLDDSAVSETLRAELPWMGSAEARLEIVHRIKLWRMLTGDDRFDIDHWLTRIENQPD